MNVGIACSVFSSFLFALLYYYSTVLRPLDGGQIFAWRVLLALPVIAVLMHRARAWNELRSIVRNLARQWHRSVLLIISAALIGVQLWLFVWAPLQQKALDVSLGYFLLPLMMVLVGRIFYNERLSLLQWVAVAAAAVGVIHELFRANSLSWATAVVVFGYPPYFMLRRRLRISSMPGLFCDMALLAPAALYILGSQETGILQQFAAHPRLLGQIPLLGIISSVALICYIAASRSLPLGLFGILGYVEPVLLFWVALLLLGEPMSPGAWLTYIPIWIAVAIIMFEGALALGRKSS